MPDAGQRTGSARELGARIWREVPRGRVLSADEWQTRHRTAVWTAVVAWVLGCVYAATRGESVGHLTEHAVAVLPALALGLSSRVSRRVRGSAIALALMLDATLVVHAAHGLSEAHFLFFVFVPLVAVYADWAPLGLAVGYVFAHHALLGLVAPEEVFEAGTIPVWERAAIHAGLILATSAATLTEWRISETRLRSLRSEVLDRSADLRRATSDVASAQAETVRRLSMAVEFRDEDTGAHTDRIGDYSARLARAVGMPADHVAAIGDAAPLHDVGKVAVPDSVLLKAGPLTDSERATMQAHARTGHRLLGGSSSALLDLAASIALTHHEKWDGSGYPQGLAGHEIPIEGRIVAIADVFDALTHDRVYRAALPFAQAVQIMRDGRGTHFEPQLLDIFLDFVAGQSPSDPDRDSAPNSDAAVSLGATA
jgi:HD-GYP domain-containing protein (c-di-GMP phosphodiesterase class II)